jgi:hypothetical protein
MIAWKVYLVSWEVAMWRETKSQVFFYRRILKRTAAAVRSSIHISSQS